MEVYFALSVVRIRLSNAIGTTVTQIKSTFRGKAKSRNQKIFETSNGGNSKGYISIFMFIFSIEIINVWLTRIPDTNI